MHNLLSTILILSEKEIILYSENFLNNFFYMNGDGKKLIENYFFKRAKLIFVW